MTEKFDDAVIDLATYIYGGEPSFKANELIKGIKRERVRLGQNPYVVVINTNEFDIDGAYDTVSLIESYRAQDEAEIAANQLATSLLSQELKNTEWKLESEGNAPYLQQPNDGKTLRAERSLFDRSFKVVSGIYDRKYVVIRVLGPFKDYVVGKPLVDLLNVKSELLSYFQEIGARA